MSTEDPKVFDHPWYEPGRTTPPFVLRRQDRNWWLPAGAQGQEGATEAPQVKKGKGKRRRVESDEEVLPAAEGVEEGEGDMQARRRRQKDKQPARESKGKCRRQKSVEEVLPEMEDVEEAPVEGVDEEEEEEEESRSRTRRGRGQGGADKPKKPVGTEGAPDLFDPVRGNTKCY